MMGGGNEIIGMAWDLRIHGGENREVDLLLVAGLRAGLAQLRNEANALRNT
jgi:hypothetical protein